MLSNRKVGDLEFLLTSLYHTPGLRSDGHVLIHLALPYEVKIELSRVNHSHLTGLLLVNKELSKVEIARLA
jgi:hypothetical protein